MRSLGLSPGFPLGDAVEVFVRREDAERFIAEVRGDDPEGHLLPDSEEYLRGLLDSYDHAASSPVDGVEITSQSSGT